MLPTATKPTTAATMARIESKPLAAGAAATPGDGLGATGAARWATGAAAARGAAGVGAAGAVGAVGAALAPVGPPGGSVGSLMVGAAEGLGGRLMRTVSFLGWTLPVSFFGGTAPLGMFGMFSAITNLWLQDNFWRRSVKPLFKN